MARISRVHFGSGCSNSSHESGDFRHYAAVSNAVPYVTTLAVDDPALYAAKALLDALEKRGVLVKGAALSLHRPVSEALAPEEGIELAKHLSEPLLEGAAGGG